MLSGYSGPKECEHGNTRYASAPHDSLTSPHFVQWRSAVHGLTPPASVVRRTTSQGSARRREATRYSEPSKIKQKRRLRPRVMTPPSSERTQHDGDVGRPLLCDGAVDTIVRGITVRFEKDAAAEAQLSKTVRLDSVRQEDFDTVFYPGGHGPMWDLAEDEHSLKLIESFIVAGKPIGIVCHSTGALRHVRTPDGKLLVQGKEVTGFTNGEEEEVGLTKIVPFLVEDEMLKLGAVFSKKANWVPHVVSDGLLITGQNPHSSGRAAKTLMAAVKQKAGPVVAARAS